MVTETRTDEAVSGEPPDEAQADGTQQEVQLPAPPEEEPSAPPPEPGPDDRLNELQRKVEEAQQRLEAQERALADQREREERRQRRSQSQRDREERDRKAFAGEQEELVDTVKATLGAAGYSSDQIAGEPVVKAIDRVMSKRQGQITDKAYAAVDAAFQFFTGELDEDDLSEPEAEAVRRLHPKMQAWGTKAAPALRQDAVDKQIPTLPLDDLMKRLTPEQVRGIADRENARRNAQNREGARPLPRVEGETASTNSTSLEAWENRVAHQGEDGFPMFTTAEWAAYRQVRREHGLS